MRQNMRAAGGEETCEELMAPQGTRSRCGKKKRKGGSAARTVGFVLSRIGRFASLPALRRRNVAKKRGRKSNRATAILVDACATAQVDKPCGGGTLIYSRSSQPTEGNEVRKQDSWEWAQMKFKTGASWNSWRDPDAKFCCICGDGDDQHMELTCPYNYLSPATYAPCRARLTLWNDEINSTYKRYRRKRPSREDAVISRHRMFLQCFVRANNLPECCRPEQFVRLFTKFGPLWMYHVAMHSSEMCGGFGYVVFKHREHAKEATKKLNCCNVDGRKLRVDLAYPNA